MDHQLTPETPTLWSRIQVVYLEKSSPQVVLPLSAVVENLNDALVNHLDLSIKHHSELTGKN